MIKKIDGRIPREAGAGVMKMSPAAVSPWHKLVSYRDAVHYASRYNAVLSAALMQAYRILVPDYVERSKAICAAAHNRLYNMYPEQVYMYMRNLHNQHPFCCGSFVGGLLGDIGDEGQLMCGRVNDFGTYRVEKELDVCDWDIVGTELCRATTASLKAGADRLAHWGGKEGPELDFCMVEAKGAGDLHCRIVAESREKYPMPEHEQWDCFGPIATADLIKHTPEEECVYESEFFREECDYKFCSGTCQEATADYAHTALYTSGATYILPAIEMLIAQGELDAKFADHVLSCCCEGAGKAVFGEFYAKEGMRQWLGAPSDVNDGRLMGAHIEMYLQCANFKYDIIAFNKDEVMYDIDLTAVTARTPMMGRLPEVLVPYWYGMTKSLVNAQWSLWKEESPAGKLRIKIAKKIDKFC